MKPGGKVGDYKKVRCVREGRSTAQDGDPGDIPHSFTSHQHRDSAMALQSSPARNRQAVEQFESSREEE